MELEAAVIDSSDCIACYYGRECPLHAPQSEPDFDASLTEAQLRELRWQADVSDGLHHLNCTTDWVRRECEERGIEASGY